jgi:hypothetical protein
MVIICINSGLGNEFLYGFTKKIENFVKKNSVSRKQTSTAFLLCILYGFHWMMMTF